MQIRGARSLVIVLVVSALVGCAELRSPGDSSPTGITATGTGRIMIRPDTAVVQVGAETRAPNLADATADVARRMTAILERVRALGVADRDITTVTYAVDPFVAPPRSEADSARILGYRVANVAQLRIRQLDAVGRILDGAVAAGANTVRGPSFTVADLEAVEAQARAQAVANATARARQLAEAAGVALGDLVTLTEGPPPPVPRLMAASTAQLAVAPGPIEPGQLEISMTVTAHYRIKR